MQLPFTTDQFLGVMRAYNEAVWPAQLLLLVLGVAAVVFARRADRVGARSAGLLLAALWAWMGVVYHLVFFRPINPAATIFGAAFLLQAVLLAWAALSGRLVFERRRDAGAAAGAAAILYAMALYPALGHALGHRYPTLPTFGLPCPTTILTLGMLLWARPGSVALLAPIPLLWAAVGTSAALRLGMREDFGLAIAAMLLVLDVSRRSWRARTHRLQPS